MKPPISYFGAKTAIASRVIPLLPDHEHYVEPFAGSLAMLLAKPPSRMETVSDLDGQLMAFWRVLRDRPADLERVCMLTPHSRAELAAAYEPAEDELEAARRVWVILTQGRGGHLGTRGGGWRFYADPRGSSISFPEYLGAYLSRIAPAAARLRSVTLECRPALEMIATYGQHPGVLIYADPPYLRSSRAWAIQPGYVYEMLTEADHRELAAALHGARSAVVLSGYDSPLYAELYRGWYRHEIAGYASNAAAGDRSRTEVLWSNRPFPQATLFDTDEAAS